MKTVTKDLAVKLKEAGYPQNSHFMWNNWLYGELEYGKGKENYQGEYRLIDIPPFSDPENQFAAPTAEEILDELPHAVGRNTLKVLKSHDGKYAVMYGDTVITYSWYENLAEAAGKMWLYLKKEGLL